MVPRLAAGVAATGRGAAGGRGATGRGRATGTGGGIGGGGAACGGGDGGGGGTKFEGPGGGTSCPVAPDGAAGCAAGCAAAGGGAAVGGGGAGGGGVTKFCAKAGTRHATAIVAAATGVSQRFLTRLCRTTPAPSRVLRLVIDPTQASGHETLNELHDP